MRHLRLHFDRRLGVPRSHAGTSWNVPRRFRLILFLQYRCKKPLRNFDGTRRCVRNLRRLRTHRHAVCSCGATGRRARRRLQLPCSMPRAFAATRQLFRAALPASWMLVMATPLTVPLPLPARSLHDLPMYAFSICRMCTFIVTATTHPLRGMLLRKPWHQPVQPRHLVVLST